MAYQYWKLDEPDIWSWEHYIDGFRTAADSLAASTAGEWRASNLVYPTMFLYRHYLELRIKQLIVGFRKLLGLPEEVPAPHQLLSLWESLRDLELQAIKSGEWSATESFDKYPEVESLIREFNRIDQDSYEFRYPVNKKGATHLRRLKEEAKKGLGTNLEVPPQFDLTQVREEIKKATLALDGAIDMIDECINLKAEMHQDAM